MLSKIDLFIILLLCLGLTACQETAQETTNSSTTITQEAPPRLFMKTLTRNLRVRQTPDLEGSVLKILQAGLIVEYLHDSTKFTTEITYQRKDYNRTWYKIQTADKTEGWVYSAFLEFLPDEENQKIVIQRETAELLEAANEKNPQLTKKQERELKQPVNESLVSSYRSFLSGLSKNDPNSIGTAINKFKSSFIGRNVRTCDAAYVVFHTFYRQTLAVLGRSNFDKYQYLAAEIKRYQRATMQVDAYTQLLANNGFNMSIKNGKVILAEDPDFLYRIFYRECSMQMRAYMNQYQLEEPNFWLDQEELFITPKMLSRWVLSWNYFVATYPDFIWHADAKDRLEKKLTILLQGTSKQPAFNDSDYALEAAYLEAYRHISDNYPDSKIGKAFKEYIDVLETNNWKHSSDVTQAQNKIMRTFVL